MALRIVMLLALSLPGAVADARGRTLQEVELQGIAYHDVRDHVVDDVDPDDYAISTRNLVAHFHWLRENGFVPVSVDQILDARAGGLPLPDNAVLLTFDDGFRSVYTHVFPLLKLFGYPALVSVVTSWVDGDVRVEQGGETLTREDFLTWEQIREMHGSGLVEIASHSHDLHRGIVGNPQGNEQPAAVTRAWSRAGYEDRAAYAARIERDLATSVEQIERHVGRRPRVMTWPYGERNAATTAIARRLGMPLDMTLGDGRNAGRTATLGRHLIADNPGVDDLAYTLLHATADPIVRVAQVDLDYVYDPDPAQQDQNLGALLDRIKALEISHVFLQAFADPDADGGASALYFPNRHLPVRADLFNRAAWQLKTRSNVQVYAWLPLLSYQGDGIDPAWRVMQTRAGVRSSDSAAEPRLSPFEPRARALIADIYRDLAIHASFDGILFHDDGRLNEIEDTNPAAVAVFAAELGGELSVDRLERDAGLEGRWARLKTRTLIDFSLELAAVVREHRPAVKTARNLFAPALLDPRAEIYLAQDLGEFLAAYDHVALMAMPYFEGAADPRAFYRRVVGAVKAHPRGLAGTIFELQTVDWRRDRRIPASELEATMRQLQAQGVRHLGYYPDDFVGGHPALRPLRAGMSLATYPSGGLR